MKGLRTAVLLVTASTAFWPFSVSGQSVDPMEELLGALEVEGVGFGEYKKTNRNFDRLRKAIRILARRADALSTMGEPVPAGAIIAFTETAGSGDCPAGWTRFEDATGRVIIGAGQDKELARTYEYYEKGGLPTHRLTRAQLPKIALALGKNGYARKDESGGHDVLQPGRPEVLGDGEVFSLMQPYRALWFCRRE